MPAEGLDSIEVMELRGSLSEATGVEIEIQSMYDNPSVRHLASYITDQLEDVVAAMELPIEGGRGITDETPGASPDEGAQGAAAEILPVALSSAPRGAEMQVTVNQLVDSSTTPVFLQQPMGVPGARAYYNFVRQHLGWISPNPVFVLDHATPAQLGTSVSSEQQPENATEAIIETLSEQINACQAVGPYIFGGHSLGGLTSLQLAIIKAEAGHSAEVWMFDAAHPKQLTPFSNEPVTEEDVLNA